jgi:hypothetical protein
MEQELKEFDKKCTKPLPPIMVTWRKRAVKIIEKEREKVYKDTVRSILFSKVNQNKKQWVAQ